MLNGCFFNPVPAPYPMDETAPDGPPQNSTYYNDKNYVDTVNETVEQTPKDPRSDKPENNTPINIPQPPEGANTIQENPILPIPLPPKPEDNVEIIKPVIDSVINPAMGRL